MTGNPNPEFPLVWDSTMRGAFTSCPKKFWWEFMRKLGPGLTSVHLHFGACLAKGVEVARYAFYAENCTQSVAEARGLRALMAEWKNYESPVDSPKSFEHCVAAYADYLNEYRFASDHIQPFIKDDTTPAVELSFAVPIPEVPHPVTGEPIIYAGRLDMLGVYNEVLWVVDEKTTGQLGATWPRQWDMRAQFTGYCWAAQQYGFPVAGAIVRGICIRKNGAIDFAQAITYRPDFMIKLWYRQLVSDLKRAVRCFEEGYWDSNLDATCGAYGGCQYKPLCEKADPEPWIEGYYVERNWNPLHRDPLDGADKDEKSVIETLQL